MDPIAADVDNPDTPGHQALESGLAAAFPSADDGDRDADLDEMLGANRHDDALLSDLSATPATDEHASDATQSLNAAISELEDALNEHAQVAGDLAGHEHAEALTLPELEPLMSAGLTPAPATESLRENPPWGEPGQPDPSQLEPERGEQYTIPLLDDVVLNRDESAAPTAETLANPSSPASVDLAPPQEVDEPLDPIDHEPEFEALRDAVADYRPVFERLASEIDVIVQAGVNEALKEAAKTIRRQVNEHIEIVLPEILDELARRSGDRDS